MKITDLNREDLLAVFSFLTEKDLINVYETCRSWKEVIPAKCLWKKVRRPIIVRLNNAESEDVDLKCLSVAPLLHFVQLSYLLDPTYGQTLAKTILSGNLYSIHTLVLNFSVIGHEDLKNILSRIACHLVVLELRDTTIIYDDSIISSPFIMPNGSETGPLLGEISPIIPNLPKLERLITDLPSLPNGPFQVTADDWLSLRLLELYWPLGSLEGLLPYDYNSTFTQEKIQKLEHFLLNHSLLLKTKHQLKILKLPVMFHVNQMTADLFNHCHTIESVEFHFTRCGKFVFSGEEFKCLEFRIDQGKWREILEDDDIADKLYSEVSSFIHASGIRVYKLVIISHRNLRKGKPHFYGIHLDRMKEEVQLRCESFADIMISNVNGLSELIFEGTVFKILDLTNLRSRYPHITVQIDFQD